MGIPPETLVGIAVFRIPEGADGLRRKERAWKYLAPYVAQAIDDHIDRMIEYVPYLSDALAKSRESYRRLLMRTLEGLFTTPVDESQIAAAKEQVTREIEIGFDMRSRATLNEAVLGGLLDGLRHNRWISKREALDIVHLASRILALDTTTGIAFHYQAKARETKAAAAELGEAIRQFSETIQEGRGLTTSSVASLGKTAGELADLARTGADQAETAAHAASDTALNVARVANSTEELFASISSIREQASSSVRMADDAVKQTDETNATIMSLSEAVEKIGSVVGLISDIAASTNMLALNATIEASRAGEAGRGFAVVAAEVKSLAKQTSQATQEISKQIGVIQEATRHAVGKIGTSSQTINGIVNIAVAVSHSVDQQAGATGSIAEGVHGAARNATTVAETLRVIENTVRRTRDAAQAALTLSEQLADSARSSGAAMDVLFQAASRHEGMRVMKRLARSDANSN